MGESIPAQLREIASNYDGISQHLFQMANMIEKNNKYNLLSKIMCVDRVAEVNTVRLRDVAARMSEKDVGMVYDEIAHILGIDVEECEHWIKIRVPAILPNRNVRDQQSFLIRPLRHALVEHQRRNPIDRFGECVICIVHAYDEAKGERRVRDYDNIETKRYLDVIESVYLTDDSGLLCSVFQTTKMEERDETTFYLMIPNSFPEWLEKHLLEHTKSR